MKITKHKGKQHKTHQNGKIFVKINRQTTKGSIYCFIIEEEFPIMKFWKFTCFIADAKEMLNREIILLIYTWPTSTLPGWCPLCKKTKSATFLQSKHKGGVHTDLNIKRIITINIIAVVVMEVIREVSFYTVWVMKLLPICITKFGWDLGYCCGIGRG